MGRWVTIQTNDDQIEAWPKVENDELNEVSETENLGLAEGDQQVIALGC